ncbi:hypothetical protein T265_02653 [Opisthorchis viverrini]|uniref:Uncharacterized protein n=1 Tax=Opisthorchis viverrini TaxID=6198 RepID=A0A074ZYA1_OPIVI|nr:hypothetical protein T265_02653 [Opisthorchis viverrini]KER30967.1 hypothetical protein T265_02653 [Opisthorchis viverrini]
MEHYRACIAVFHRIEETEQREVRKVCICVPENTTDSTTDKRNFRLDGTEASLSTLNLFLVVMINHTVTERTINLEQFESQWNNVTADATGDECGLLEAPPPSNEGEFVMELVGLLCNVRSQLRDNEQVLRAAVFHALMNWDAYDKVYKACMVVIIGIVISLV